MANPKLLIPKIQKWEGGWADDPTDNGGATMKGITLSSFTGYRKSKGMPPPTKTDLKLITETEWGAIFKTLYWDKWRADEILNQSVANILVDWVWGSGMWGIKIPQRIMGLKEDGIVGNITVTRLNSLPQAKIFEQIKAERVKFLFDIVKRDPKQNRFLPGWLNRLNDYIF